MPSVSSLISRSALAIALACAVPASAAQDTSSAAKSASDKSTATKKTDASKKKEAGKAAESSKSGAKPAPKPAARPSSAKSASATPAPTPRSGAKPAAKPTAKPTAALSRPVAPPPTQSASAALPSGDLSQLRSAVQLARNGKGTEALTAARELDDPVARSLVTWLVIRHAPNDLGFDNIVAFMRDKPGWPTQSTLRRRAERVLLAENKDPNTVRTFFANTDPLSGEGKVALARAYAATGERQAATAWVRDAWRNDELSERLEAQVMDDFGGVLTRADHKARADRFSYKPDTDRALRAAARAGSDVVTLTKARLAIAQRQGDGAKALASIPFTFANDPAYLFAKSQVMRRADRPDQAARALLDAPRSQDAVVDPDEWWIERRLVARELLDAGDPKTAYRVAANAATPSADNYRAEQHFTAGWIALSFMKDPRTAIQHFTQMTDKQTHPITLSRAFYWQGRALEAMGDGGRARSAYEKAGTYSTTYYGQLARLRLGLAPVALRREPQPSLSDRSTFSRLEAVKAIRLLYAIGERDIPLTIYYDLAWRIEDPGQLAMLADVAEANGDARGALVVGKEGLAEGLPMDGLAFPTFGLPSYSPIGTPVEKAAVYAVARQESQFNPRTLSSAKAMGLMQVTPAAGKQVAKVTGATYNEARLMNDQSYNVQFGAAELGELVDAYQGNYVLVFAAYNAGRGSVAKWISRYGDPRDPNVDVVDWVESIPFSETRNYVQRVMENYQVYKMRFNSSSRLQMEADLRGGR